MIWLQSGFRVRAYIFGLGPKLVGPFTTLGGDGFSFKNGTINDHAY